MTADTVLLSEDLETTRVLTLNRPKSLNALNDELVQSLVSAVDRANKDESVTAIVLAASGRAFSAGADLKEAATRKDHSPEEARRHAESSRAIYQLGGRTEKPVIAAVQGYVLGGGCNLAIAADMVVAGESALFGYPEVKRGMAATLVAPGLVHRIGPKAAFEMLTLGENISAAEAKALGLINRVVPDDKILEEALAMAAALAAFDQRAVQATKRVFLRSTELSLDQSLNAAQEAALMMRTME